MNRAGFVGGWFELVCQHHLAFWVEHLTVSTVLVGGHVRREASQANGSEDSVGGNQTAGSPDCLYSEWAWKSVRPRRHQSELV